MGRVYENLEGGGHSFCQVKIGGGGGGGGTIKNSFEARDLETLAYVADVRSLLVVVEIFIGRMLTSSLLPMYVVSVSVPLSLNVSKKCPHHSQNLHNRRDSLLD